MAESPAPACGAPAPRWQVHRELEGPCVRVAGHDGWHLNGYGVSWTEVPPADPLTAARPPLDVAATAALARDIIAGRCEFAGTEKSLASIILNLCDALEAARTDPPRALDALERVREILSIRSRQVAGMDSGEKALVNQLLAALDGDA